MFLLKPTAAFSNGLKATTPSSTGGDCGANGLRIRQALSGRDWKYVAEGGANVLFRHHPQVQPGAASNSTSNGTSSNSDIIHSSDDAVDMNFKGKLLRVKKCDIEDKTQATASTKKKKKKKLKGSGKEKPYVPHYPHPRQVLQYATDEIMPYLVQQAAAGDNPPNEDGQPQQLKSRKPPMHSQNGAAVCDEGRPHPRSRFLQVAELVQVDQSFLLQLNEQLLALESRPAHRRHSQIDVSLQCVMVLPDVTLPPPDDTSLLFSEDDLDIPVDFIVSESRDDDDDMMTARSTIDLTDEEGQSDETSLLLIDDHDQRRNHEESENEADLRERRSSGSSAGSTNSVTKGRLHTNAEGVLVLSSLSLSSSSSSSSSSSPHGDDSEADEDDVPVLPPTPLMTVAPRLRRLLSSYHRNIFDCCFRNICVEIKPKIGFKPKGALIPDVKKKVCRFCMHQHYKRQLGKVEEISQYCPLDLFSRDPARIRTALRALQRTPQNNFKVFVRSNQDEVVNVITGLNADALPKGASQSRYSYCRRKRMGFRRSCHSIGAENEINLGKILSGGDNGTSGDLDGGGGNDHFDDARDQLIPDVVELITEVLMKIEILDDLKKMQLLDHISVDGVWHVQQLLQRFEQVAVQENNTNGVKDKTPMTLGSLVHVLRTKYSQDREEFKQDEDLERAGSLTRCLAFLKIALQQVDDIDSVRGVKSWEELTLPAFQAFYKQLLQRFQVATTLKDCSLLLCLRRSVDDRSSYSSNGNRATGGGGMPSGSRSPCGSSGGGKKKAQKRFEHLREYEHPVAFRDMTFNCVVAVVDLDVKSHKSVDDYYRLDEKIVENFKKEFGAAVEHEFCRE